MVLPRPSETVTLSDESPRQAEPQQERRQDGQNKTGVPTDDKLISHNICAKEIMPKIVDHDQRRAEIVRVIIRVIAEHGLNGTTVRTISRTGGFSSGVLSHYFSDKDEMIKFAFEGVSDLIFDRIDQRMQGAKGPERVRIILEEHLPIFNHDDETAVALAFWEVAMHDPALRVQFKKNYGRWRDRLRAEMRALLPGVSATDVETRVDFAVASTDGLLVTFALDGEEYGSERRIMLLDRLMAILGVKEMEEAAA